MSFLTYFSSLAAKWIQSVETKRLASVASPSSSPSSSPSASPSASPTSTAFEPLCHPLMVSVTKEVDDYFLQHWNFDSVKAKKKFVDAGFSRVTCFYFPKALDDRIHFACRLLTVLFLIDDVLEDMSFEEGSAYNEKLIPISRGDVLPDRSVPVEYIMYDLWESMRRHDKEMADDILEPVFTFMRAQTDQTRREQMGLGKYFEYREKDVGKALLSALMRYSMGLRVLSTELELARPVELNCSKHISVVNDIYSFEKEVLAAEKGHLEGGALCSSVQITATETGVSVEAAKRILWVMCREWELCHGKLVAQVERNLEKPSPALLTFMKGLEYQMSGNEQWSRTTKRYSEVSSC